MWKVSMAQLIAAFIGPKSGLYSTFHSSITATPLVTLGRYSSVRYTTSPRILVESSTATASEPAMANGIPSRK